MSLDPITAILNVGSQVIDKIWPDKTEAEKQKVKLVELAAMGDLEKLKLEVSLLIGQLEINKEEAKHQSVWVSGWRPFVGWVSGGAFAYHYILQPFLVWVLSAFDKITTAPVLDSNVLMTLLLGILGLGAFRSYDKSKITNGNPLK